MRYCVNSGIVYNSPEDSEEIEEQEEEQNHADEVAATEEDETSDIAESESSGRNIFSYWSSWKQSEIIKWDWLRINLLLILISPDDIEEGEEWGDEQDYRDDDAATEDETSDIAESEISGTNTVFNEWKANEKVRNNYS